MDTVFHGVVYILAERVKRDGVTVIWSPLRNDDGTAEMFKDRYTAEYLCRAFRSIGRDCEVLRLNLAEETPKI